ncbi:MAG TPA: hypothetical protein VJ521_13955, partial [Acidobacteriota bacterium]|nr:hypothetical protein [Acidobacteriota bacterium]
FNSDRTGDMNIWIHSLKDGSVRQMTTGPGGDYQPNWSPDAKSLVFFSNRSGEPAIWLLHCANGNLKQLTKNKRMNINPFFSPDSKWIAYHGDETGRPEVWIMRADGSEKRQITRIGVRGHFLRWSADGNSIFFFCPYRERPGVFQVEIGSEEPRLIAETNAGAHISFSPDYSMMMDVAGHKSLWVTPLRSAVGKKVFEFEDPSARIDYPVWSPVGRSALFDLFRPQGGDIWMLSL